MSQLWPVRVASLDEIALDADRRGRLDDPSDRPAPGRHRLPTPARSATRPTHARRHAVDTLRGLAYDRRH